MNTGIIKNRIFNNGRQEDEVMDKIIQGKESIRMETVRQSNTWYQPSTLTWIRVSQELNNEQGNQGDKNDDAEILDNEIQINRTENQEHPAREVENMGVVRNQEEQITKQVGIGKKVQLDIRDAMKAQETAKRYTNRQRIEPTITRPIDRIRKEIRDKNKKNLINILQTNQQKKKIANTHLIIRAEESYLNGENWIFIIQEPRVIKNTVKCKSRYFDTLYKKGGTKVPRTCILIPKELNPWLVNQHSNEDQTTVGLKVNGEEWYICSIYNPYNNDSTKPPINNFVKETIKYYNRKKLKLIIGMDANAHSTAWGSTNDNRRGNQLLAIINELSLNIENRGKTPTFYNELRNEVLDITLTNMEACDRINNWKVREEWDSKSDHNYMTYTLDKHIERPTQKVIRNLRKMDKNKYIEYVNSKTNEQVYTECNTTDEKANLLNKIMEEAVAVSCPKIIPPKKLNKPWWDMELKKQNEELLRLKKRMIKMRDQGKTEEEERIKAIRIEIMEKYGRKMDKKKQDNWKNFTSEFVNMSDSEKLSKILKGSQNNFMQTLKTKTGEYTSTPKETLECLLDKHFPEKQEQELEVENDYQITQEEIDDIKSFVTANKIKEAFKSFKPHKSPGIDGIKPLLLHNLPGTTLNTIRELYIECLITREIPKTWQKAKVVFIPKPGKDD